MEQLEQQSFNPLKFSSLEKHPEKSNMLTGLKFDVLCSVIKYISMEKKINPQTQPHKMVLEDQIIFTLVKLKHNVNFEFLACSYGISKTTGIKYFWTWVDIMFSKLSPLIRMQDRENIFETIPAVFKSKFPRLTCIIDCFEIFIESPGNLLARTQCYSHYKNHCTIKVFVSCSPLGGINFISRCWGGKASDIQIVRDSKFASKSYHMPGDQILADRGFTLKDDFATESCSELLIPSFTKGKNQLSANEVELSRKIASVRIHIERVIGQIKNRYLILKDILPLRTIKNIADESFDSHLSNCDKIVTVCAALVNLGESIVYRQ